MTNKFQNTNTKFQFPYRRDFLIARGGFWKLVFVICDLFGICCLPFDFFAKECKNENTINRPYNHEIHLRHVRIL